MRSHYNIHVTYEKINNLPASFSPADWLLDTNHVITLNVSTQGTKNDDNNNNNRSPQSNSAPTDLVMVACISLNSYLELLEMLLY